MAYIVVGILVWIAAAFAIAFILGRAIKIADNQEHRNTAARISMAFENTATRV